MTSPLVDRSRPPAAAAVKPFRFPTFERRRLSSGLTVLATRHRGSALYRLELDFPAGAALNAPRDAGLATFTALLLDDGTSSRSAHQIATTAERLGARLATGATWDVGSLSVELLAHHRQQGLALLAELATESAFPQEEIARLRADRAAELIRLTSDPAFLARDRFRRVVYGDLPYGRSPIGTGGSLERFDRQRVESFFQRRYKLSGALAVVVGDDEPEALIEEVATLFDRPGDQPSGSSTEIVPTPLGHTQVHLVDRPGAAQTQLLMGHAGIARSDDRFVATAVLTSLLGGKFTSRINLNLRERHGYTYGAACSLAGRRGPGPWTVSTAVANPVAGAAATQVLYELQRIRDEVVEVDELEDTQNYLIGVFPYTLQTVGNLAFRLENLGIYDLPDDYYDTYPDRIRAIDRETLQATAREVLQPDRLAIVAVGPAAELEPQFAPLGPVTVHSLE
ncbi:MAG: pitrilysin family protein [Acidobacteriota bacterium]